MKTLLSLLFAVSLIGIAGPLRASDAATPSENEYRVLVVNDDGIDAAGLHALVKELKKTMKVVVAAPAEQQSGRSMSTSIHFKFESSTRVVSKEPIKVEKHFKDGEFFGIAVHGTPADAASMGIKYFELDGPIDLVVSGINEGANLGDARGSGTIGAALRAMKKGFPSIAISSGRSDTDDYSVAARYAAKFIGQLRKHGAPENTVLSVNVPAGDIKGVIAAPASVSQSAWEVQKLDPSVLDKESFEWSLRADLNISKLEKENSNTYFFRSKDFITITPIKRDNTDYEVLSQLNLWDLAN